MRVLYIPTDMVLDLGYRKLALKAGERPYPDEIANHPNMAVFWEPPPAPEPETEEVGPEPAAAPVHLAPEPEPEPEIDPTHEGEV